MARGGDSTGQDRLRKGRRSTQVNIVTGRESGTDFNDKTPNQPNDAVKARIVSPTQS